LVKEVSCHNQNGSTSYNDVMLKMFGDWFNGSGWSACTCIQKAGITSPEKAESLISASNVKRTGYAHHLSLAALHILLQKVFHLYQQIAYQSNLLEFDQ